MNPKGQRIVVAMSGGVDSSVAAALLKEEGYDVVGLFMRHGVEVSEAASRGKQGCCSLEDSMDARKVAAQLDVPFYAVNFSKDFDRIVDYFAAEYHAGRTPNPCIQCNRWLKFGKLLDYADQIGASHVATGHYARIVMSQGRHAVSRGLDHRKDQSYVLFPLSQEQLSRTLLPLGSLTKTEVRQRAEDLGFAVSDKPDSQEICFVPDQDYGGFLRRREPARIQPGFLIDVSGEVVGEHQGYQLYTIGQRRGLGGGFTQPRYVVDIRPEDNQVIIGGPEDLLAQALECDQVTWQGEAPLASGEEIQGHVKVRYSHEPAPARLRVLEGRVRMTFEKPLRAVTTGQAAVFYRADCIVCGGFIDRVLKADESGP